MTDQELIAEWQDRYDACHPSLLNDYYLTESETKQIYGIVLHELKTREFVFRQNKPVPPDPNWVYPQQDYTEINP